MFVSWSFIAFDAWIHPWISVVSLCVSRERERVKPWFRIDPELMSSEFCPTTFSGLSQSWFSSSINGIELNIKHLIPSVFNIRPSHKIFMSCVRKVIKNLMTFWSLLLSLFLPLFPSHHLVHFLVKCLLIFPPRKRVEFKRLRFGSSTTFFGITSLVECNVYVYVVSVSGSLVFWL